MKNALLLALALAVPKAADPIRIVCIGDSITQGRKGGGQDLPTRSYRYPLWKKLVDAEARVDFVGSLKEGFGGDPDWAPYKGKAFDPDHEGHWGWTSRAVREKLPEWMKTYTPDIALVLLCTNDGNPQAKMTTDDTQKEISTIVDQLRAKNPKVVVLLGKPFQEWKPFPEIRTKFDELAKKLSTPQSPVVTVDPSKGWVSKPDLPGTHTVDWVHPNEVGDAKLADVWFEALQPHLKRLGALK